MFLNKNWMLSGVKTVLSKVDATGSVERYLVSSLPRMAHSPDTISDMATEQSVLNPIDYGVWGESYNSVCTTTTRSRTWKSCSSVLRSRGGMGPSGPGSDRQCDQLMAQATNSLRCSRWRTFWTFIPNITAFVHVLINMFWTLLTLLSFLQNRLIFPVRVMVWQLFWILEFHKVAYQHN